MKAFTGPAKTASHTETGRQLQRTPPAIGQALRELEENIGCRLIAKMSKKNALAQAGEALLYQSPRPR